MSAGWAHGEQYVANDILFEINIPAKIRSIITGLKLWRGKSSMLGRTVQLICFDASNWASFRCRPRCVDWNNGQMFRCEVVGMQSNCQRGIDFMLK